MYVGSESRQFVHEAEPRFEQVLGHHCRTLADRVESDELRLQVRRKAWVRQRDDVDGLGPPVHRHPETLWEELDHGATGDEFVQRDLKMSGVS